MRKRAHLELYEEKDRKPVIRMNKHTRDKK